MERRYQSTIEVFPDIAIEIDPNCVCIWSNDLGLDFLGEDLCGSQIGNYLVRDEDQTDISEEIRAVCDGQKELAQIVSLVYRTDGEMRVLEWHLRAIKGDGEILGIMATARDVTEVREREIQLEDNKELLEGVLDGIMDAIIVQLPDSTIRRCNEAGYKFLGKGPEDVVRKRCHEVLGCFEECDVCAMKLAVESKRPQVIEKYLPELKVYLNCKSTPILDRGGGVRLVVGHLRDITPIKEAEMRLRAVQEQQKALLNNIPDIAWLKDSESRIIAVNQPFAMACGTEPGNLVGKTDLDIWPIRLAEMYMRDDLEVIETGQQKRVVEPLVDSTGRRYWIETIKTPIFDEDGSIAGTVGIARDVDERIRMEEELRRARDDLERRVEMRTSEISNKNAEMERFIYTVSHDLRSPLVTVNGFLGFLKRDLEKGDFRKIDDDIEMVDKALKRMDRLLGYTLELSRIGRVVNPLKKVSFGDMVEEALSQIGELIRARGVEMVVADSWPTVEVDRVRIVEVLVNLIENCLKYMGALTRPEIVIGHRFDEMGPVFFVKDNGIGIDQSQVHKVFELFYKVDIKSEGSGVGLAIVKRIVEVHGGTIWVESESGEGCSFCFTLPGPN